MVYREQEYTTLHDEMQLTLINGLLKEGHKVHTEVVADGKSIDVISFKKTSNDPELFIYEIKSTIRSHGDTIRQINNYKHIIERLLHNDYYMLQKTSKNLKSYIYEMQGLPKSKIKITYILATNKNSMPDEYLLAYQNEGIEVFYMPSFTSLLNNYQTNLTKFANAV